MGLERRLSEAFHSVADADPPADLIEQTVSRLGPRPRFRAPSAGMPLALAAGLAALVVVALAVALLWRDTEIPPAGSPTPSATVGAIGTPTPAVSDSPLPVATQPATPRECPTALIEGTLVEGPPGEVALMQVPIVEPAGATPIIIPVTWEPAYFVIVEEDGAPAIAHPSGLVLAQIGDYVEIGGGEQGSGWYACGALTVLSDSEPPLGTIENDDPQAWRILAGLERELGTIELVRRMERTAGGLELEFFLRSSWVVPRIEEALVRLGLVGQVAVQTVQGEDFVSLSLAEPIPERPLPPQLYCGTQIHARYRVEVGADADIESAQAAASAALEGRITRALADRFVVFGAPEADADVLLILGFSGPLRTDSVRDTLAGPVSIDFLMAPEDSSLVVGQRVPEGLDRLFGGSAVGTARPVVDNVGRPAVDVVLRPDAARALDAFAEQNVGGQLVIALDGYVEVAPSIQAPRFDGELRLMGDFRIEDVLTLANALAARADQIELVEQRVERLSVDC